MAAKVQKLEEQFRSDAAKQKKDGTPSAIFSGVAIYVNGYTGWVIFIFLVPSFIMNILGLRFFFNFYSIIYHVYVYFSSVLVKYHDQSYLWKKEFIFSCFQRVEAQ